MGSWSWNGWASPWSEHFIDCQMVGLARKCLPLAGEILVPNISNFDKGFIWENPRAGSMDLALAERLGRCGEAARRFQDHDPIQV